MRRECAYKYRNGMCEERDATHMYNNGAVDYPLGSDYCINPINTLIKMGKFTQEFVDNLVTCMFEGAGKMMFLDPYTTKGLRDWLGVPDSVHDGRTMGAYIEVLLQTIQCSYKVQAFNKEEVIYDIETVPFLRKMPMLKTAYMAMWYGMVKTMIGPEWSLWEEEGAPEGSFRIHIGEKIDKFCR